MPTAIAQAKAAHVTYTDLEKQAISALRRLVGYEVKRTQALKDFANSLIAIRKEMNDPAGTSQAYRDAAARVYAAVDIPPDSQSSLQASIRYHIGNVLREVFTPEELIAVGLSEKTPLERARDARTAPVGGTASAVAENAPAPVISIPEAVAIAEATGAPPEKVTILAPVNPPKPKSLRKEKRDYTERPRPVVGGVPDPLVLVGHALDTIRAAASLDVIPATEVASLRDMLRRMRMEMERMEARLADAEKTSSSSHRARPAAKKTS